MVEIEHIQDIEKDQPAKSSAKEQKLKDPVDANTETQDTEVKDTEYKYLHMQIMKILVILMKNLQDFLELKL